jgi:hypothetical protein
MIEIFQSLTNEFRKGACNIFWKVLVELHAWKLKGTKNSMASYKKNNISLQLRKVSIAQQLMIENFRLIT